MISFPKHLSLTLTHNEHKTVYKTVERSIEDQDHGYNHWVSPEQRQKAIGTNDCWTLQWFLSSPTGSITVSAADLDVLLAFCESYL